MRKFTVRPRSVYGASALSARDFLLKNLSPSFGYEDDVDRFLNKVDVSGLSNTQILLFAKLWDAWAFRAPRPWTKSDLEAVIDRNFELFPDEKNGGRFNLGDYGYPEKLMNALCDVLESRGYAVRSGRAPAGGHSEWVVAYSNNTDPEHPLDYWF